MENNSNNLDQIKTEDDLGLREKLLNQFLKTQSRAFISVLRNVDMSKYLVPLEKGWKRELVCRSDTIDTSVIKCDVYYHPPCGRKLRSCKEVNEFLNTSNYSDLSQENFTFVKMFVDTNNREQEICRISQPKSIRTSTSSPLSTLDKVVRGREGKRKRRLVSVTKVPNKKKSTTQLKIIKRKKPLNNQSCYLDVKPINTETSKDCTSENVSVHKRRKYKFLNRRTSSSCNSSVVITESSSGRKRILPKYLADFKLPLKYTKKAQVKPDASISAVKNKQSTSEASLLSDNPRGSLCSNLKAGLKMDPKTTFSRSQEDELESLIKNKSETHDGVTRTEIRQIAFQFAEENRIKHTFNRNNKLAGHFWLIGFLKRHRSINIIQKKSQQKLVQSVTHLDNGTLPANTITLINDEPSTSSSNGESVLIDVKNEYLDLSVLNDLNYLSKIVISSSLQIGFFVVSVLTPLKMLTSLNFLEMTYVRNLSLLNVEVIGTLTNLEHLHLGFCENLSDTFGQQVLIHLNKLKTLRLVGGQGTCIVSILNAVAQMPSVEQVELLNFEIVEDFGKALTDCKNIRRLLLQPQYVSEAHYIIPRILKALFGMQQLETFTLVITDDLIELVKRFNRMHGRNINNCVPVLEIIPTICVKNTLPSTFKGKSPIRKIFSPQPLRVEFITVDHLRDLFSKTLPTTQVTVTTVSASEMYKVCLSENLLTK